MQVKLFIYEIFQIFPMLEKPKKAHFFFQNKFFIFLFFLENPLQIYINLYRNLHFFKAKPLFYKEINKKHLISKCNSLKFQINCEKWFI